MENEEKQMFSINTIEKVSQNKQFAERFVPASERPGKIMIIYQNKVDYFAELNNF